LSLLPLLCCTCPATPSIYPLSLPDALPIYLSDLDPGDADDRASLEPLDVIEARFERIAVPRKPAGAADGNDQQRGQRQRDHGHQDRKSTRLNSSHGSISYAVFCLKKKRRSS